MKPTFSNFQQIDIRLRQLDLERQIAKEELKLLKTEISQEFQPYSWVEPLVKGASKYGIFYMLKALFSKR
ncbi:hypothetical protein ACFSQP_01860 [Bizionia sediminis]|uniref:Uncharacterized protein n=1 Tax=Bizionia sediminis TaxID=1737064 RepID=A0ABW5KS43_9FLAO